MRTKLLILPGLIMGFCFLYCYQLSAQDYKKLNILKQEIFAAPQDTQLVNNLYKYISNPEKKIQKDSVIEYYKFLFTVSSKIHLHKIAGTTGSKLGNYYNGLGDYTKALFYLFESEKAFAAIKSYKKLSGLYSLIGNTYMGLNNKKEQQNYFSKAYKLASEHNLPDEKARGAIGLSSYFGSVTNFKEAIKWDAIANSLFEAQKNYVGYCISKSNGAGYYLQLNNLDKAKEYLDLAEEKLPLANSNYAAFVCYQGQGQLNDLRKNYNLAIVYYTKGLKLMILDKAIHNISEMYKRLSQTAYEAKLFKESADYLALHIQYKDSVFNETSSKQLLDVQEKYDTEKKNAEIQLLNKENDFNKSEINRKKILIYSVIAVIALLLVLFVFVIRANIQKNKTNTLLEKQKIIIEEKQKEIVDSITYAKRIQYTFLANKEMINTLLPNHFVFFLPKDIVSGDFYWMSHKNNFTYLAVCDCTGHGVPGAFMSLLASNFLSEAITDKNISEPHHVLNYVRERLIASLDGSNDGMDAILIKIPDSVSKIETGGKMDIEFASANNTLIVVRDKEIIELPTDKMPVGKGIKSESFTLQKTEVYKNDALYLYTDGYADQFGGPKGKKFKYKELNNLLLTNSSQPILNQAKLLEQKFINWKGDLEQVDDVCIIGIKI